MAISTIDITPHPLKTFWRDFTNYYKINNEDVAADLKFSIVGDDEKYLIANKPYIEDALDNSLRDRTSPYGQNKLERGQVTELELYQPRVAYSIYMSLVELPQETLGQLHWMRGFSTDDPASLRSITIKVISHHSHDIGRLAAGFVTTHLIDQISTDSCRMIAYRNDRRCGLSLVPKIA